MPHIVSVTNANSPATYSQENLTARLAKNIQVSSLEAHGSPSDLIDLYFRRLTGRKFNAEKARPLDQWLHQHLEITKGTGKEGTDELWKRLDPRVLIKQIGFGNTLALLALGYQLACQLGDMGNQAERASSLKVAGLYKRALWDLETRHPHECDRKDLSSLKLKRNELSQNFLEEIGKSSMLPVAWKTAAIMGLGLFGTYAAFQVARGLFNHVTDLTHQAPVGLPETLEAPLPFPEPIVPVTPHYQNITGEFSKQIAPYFSPSYDFCPVPNLTFSGKINVTDFEPLQHTLLPAIINDDPLPSTHFELNDKPLSETDDEVSIVNTPPSNEQILVPEEPPSEPFGLSVPTTAETSEEPSTAHEHIFPHAEVHQEVRNEIPAHSPSQALPTNLEVPVAKEASNDGLIKAGIVLTLLGTIACIFRNRCPKKPAHAAKTSSNAGTQTNTVSPPIMVDEGTSPLKLPSTTPARSAAAFQSPLRPSTSGAASAARPGPSHDDQKPQLNLASDITTTKACKSLKDQLISFATHAKTGALVQDDVKENEVHTKDIGNPGNNFAHLILLYEIKQLLQDDLSKHYDVSKLTNKVVEYITRHINKLTTKMSKFEENDFYVLWAIFYDMEKLKQNPRNFEKRRQLQDLVGDEWNDIYERFNKHQALWILIFPALWDRVSRDVKFFLDPKVTKGSVKVIRDVNLRDDQDPESWDSNSVGSVSNVSPPASTYQGAGPGPGAGAGAGAGAGPALGPGDPPEDVILHFDTPTPNEPTDTGTAAEAAVGAIPSSKKKGRNKPKRDPQRGGAGLVSPRGAPVKALLSPSSNAENPKRPSRYRVVDSNVVRDDG